MRSPRAFALGLLTTWLLAVGGSAQTPSPTGNLYGTALDTQEKAVPGVSVTLTGPGAAHRSDSDAKGDFHFLELSPGSYSLRLERAGLETARRDVMIVVGRSVVLSITMPVAGATEAVTIRSDAPMDPREVETGATFSQEELETTPTTRDPWAFVRQVPGVLVDNMNAGRGRRPRQTAFVGKGSNPDQNRYNLDGVAISQGGVSPIYYDFDSFESIEVTTGGSNPSLATAGVSVNLVTKRGTNQLLGSARGFYTGGAGWEYGIEAGGPVWKDHLWFWGAASSNAFLGRTLFAADEEPVDNQETLKHWNGKLNATLIPANTLTLSGTGFDRVSLGLGASPDVSLPATSTNTLDSQVFSLADSHVLSPKLFAALSVSSVKTKVGNTPLGGLDEQADLDRASIWRYSNSHWRVEDTQQQAGLNASAFFETGNLGHELKFGFGYRHAQLDSASSWPGDQLVGLAPTREAAITRPQITNSEVNSYDLFLGDTIRAGNLTVGVSVRFDSQQGRNLPSAVPANPVFPALLPAVEYGGDSAYPMTWHQVEPRVGATYALNDSRTLLRASYSRFADELNTFTVRTINPFPGKAELVYPWKDRNRNGRVEAGEVDVSEPLCCPAYVDPDNPGAAVPINQISPSLAPPTTDEFIVGMERQIAPGFSGSLAYTYRVFRNLEFAPLIGTTRADYQYLGNVTGPAEAADGFVLDFSEPSYGLAECPDPCVGVLLQNRPDAQRTYSGVELQLMKSYSHGWMARVSFAYNDWQQRIGPGAIVDPNNEPPGTNASGPVVDGRINATWQFNVSGMVELPFGIAAAVNLFGRQGFPILYEVLVITPGTSFRDPTLLIGPATRYRNPNVYQLDLQLMKAFPIGSTIMVIPQVTCLNVLDSHTVLSREGFVGTYTTETQSLEVNTALFNVVSERLSPRVFRGGVRVTF